jgi:hypothetical protein
VVGVAVVSYKNGKNLGQSAENQTPRVDFELGFHSGPSRGFNI